LCILENKQISPTRLVEILGIAKSNVAKFCKELEDENKIFWQSDEFDRRGKYYSLTKSGEKYVYSCLTSLEKALANLGEKDLEKMIVAVGVINEILTSKGEENA
jgi:DNA-binding MarR family transcriptional regulator